MSAEENPNIGELSGLAELEEILNIDSTWKLLLKVLPPLYANQDLLLSIESDRYRPGLSEARIFLQRLAAQGVRKSMLIEWLEEANLEDGLVILKKEEEPLQIVEQPVACLEITEGHDLKLVCRAHSFRRPHYLWFRKRGEDMDIEELTTQREPKLSISPVKTEDAGVYKCRVHKINYNGSPSCIFSEESVVTVIHSACEEKSHKKDSIMKNMHYGLLKDGWTPNFDELYQDENENEFSSDNSIKIKKQPVNAEVKQGTTLVLKFVAESQHELHYQWYCNGNEIAAEKSCELKLEDLRPNCFNGEMESTYLCLVYNDFNKVLSDPAFVKLKPVDETVQHFPEEKIALLIANDTYDDWPALGLPAADVVTIAKGLKSIDFKVLAFRNLKYHEMKNAVHVFCSMLKPNSYGLYYYAGHGFEIGRQTYAVSVDSSSNPDVEKCLCTEYVLKRMKERKTAMNVMLFDACRKHLPCHPKKKTDESFSVSQSIYFYSTSSLEYSRESTMESNGYFVKYLKKYLTKKMKIMDIVTKVQEDLKADTDLKGCQEPNLYCGFTEHRSLRDEVQQTGISYFDRLFSWTNNDPVFDDMYFKIGNINSTITLRFFLHKETFCNALDVHLCFVYDCRNLPTMEQVKLELHTSPADKVVTINTPEDGKLGLLYLKGVSQLLNLQSKEKLDCELLIQHQEKDEIQGRVKFSLESPILSRLHKMLSVAVS